MPSDLLSPFLELDLDLCEKFLSLQLLEEPGSEGKSPGASRGTLQRTHSVCLASTEQLGGSSSSCWPVHSLWSRSAKLPRSGLLQHIPFQVDRSVSMIEGPSSGTTSSYKTELCRSFQEKGARGFTACCQFAHGLQELQSVTYHPKHRTVSCCTFHAPSYCPSWSRCHFFHNPGGQQPEALISCCPPESLFHGCMEPSVCCPPETLHLSCTQPMSSLPSSLRPDGSFSCSKDSLSSPGIFTAALCRSQFGSFLSRTQASDALQAPDNCSTLLAGLQWQRSQSWGSLSEQDEYSSCGSESPDPGVGRCWLPATVPFLQTESRFSACPGWEILRAGGREVREWRKEGIFANGSAN